MSDVKNYFEFERIFEHELFGKAITTTQMTKIADLFYAFVKERKLFGVFDLRYKELFNGEERVCAWLEDKDGHKLTHTDIDRLKFNLI